MPTTPSLLWLTYVSRAAAPMEPPAMAALLEQCRAGNEALGISGVLCSGRGHFVQLIEGPQHNVVALFTAIMRDPRHRDVVLLDIGLTRTRAFADWHMGHVDGDAMSDETHARLTGFARTTSSLSEPAKLLQSTLQILRGEPRSGNGSRQRRAGI